MKKIYGWDYYLETILKSPEDKVKKALEEKDESYRLFEIPKKGGVRKICGIDGGKDLYLLQRNLYKNFLSRIPIALPAKGFAEGVGYQDFLRPHRGRNYYLRLDIRDFFDSITAAQVREALREFVQDDVIVENMMEICLLRDRVPQGAVTSPAISNIIFRRIDQRILKYCQAIRTVRSGDRRCEEDITYTRYADDLLFSGDFFDFRTQRRFCRKIGYILRENGFHLNRDKMCATEGQIVLSGFVVEKDVHLSRKKLRDLNRILLYFDRRTVDGGERYRIDWDKVKDGEVLEKLNALFGYYGADGKWVSARQFDCLKSAVNYLCGYRAFLIEFFKTGPQETDALKNMKKKIRRLEMLIEACQKTWFGITKMDKD